MAGLGNDPFLSLGSLWARNWERPGGVGPPVQVQSEQAGAGRAPCRAGSLRFVTARPPRGGQSGWRLHGRLPVSRAGALSPLGTSSENHTVSLLSFPAGYKQVSSRSRLGGTDAPPSTGAVRQEH